jgi:uncharacterized RDD family membrane protein YckC
MLPLYVGVMLFVGAYTGEGRIPDAMGDSVAWIAMNTTLLVLIGGALLQLLALPLRITAGHAIFRLAVVNAKGEPARLSERLARWSIAWLPLLVPMSLAFLLIGRADDITFISALVLLLLWIAAAGYSVIHPNRGLHDRLAGTWVVRR